MDLIDSFREVMDLLEMKDYDAAASRMEAVANQIPDDGPMQKFAGLLYQKIGADAHSLKGLSRARVLLPDDNSILLHLGYHYLDNAEPGTARNLFEEYLEADPASQEALYHLGRALDLLGDGTAAVEKLRQAHDLDPAGAEAALHFGRVLIRNGKYADAGAVFETVLSHHPDHFLAETGLARARAFANGRVRTGIAKPSAEPATVACLKYGTKYGPEYVNRLASMIDHWTETTPKILCFTDDASGITGRVITRPLPEAGLSGWWNKLSLFREEIAGDPEAGSHLLYFDLDVVLTGPVDPLLHYDSDFAIIDNPYIPGFNSSVMRFKTGHRQDLWADFSEDAARRLPGDQDWIGLKVPDADLFPDGWCVLYRLHAVKAPPADARVVCFSWRPNPADKPSPWIEDYWR